MSAFEVIVLRDGFPVPVDILGEMWRLESQGVTFEVADGSPILVGPRELLNETELTFLRAWKPVIRHIVDARAFRERQS